MAVVKPRDEFRELREVSAAVLQNLTEGLENGVEQGLTRDDLVAAGKRLWPHVYQGASSDEEAFQRYAQYALHMLKGHDSGTKDAQISAAVGSAMLYLPMEQMLYFWSCRWADQTFPSVTMGHKYAAALMSTSIAPEHAKDVIPPYEAFLIELPDKLLQIQSDNGSFDARFIAVQRILSPTTHTHVWNYIITTTSSVTLWRHGVPTEDLAEADLEEHATAWESYSFALETTDHDTRVNILVGRLILGTCLALSSKDSSKQVGKGHSKSSSELQRGKDPLVRIFQVGTPIKIDCREAIRDYLEGRKHSAPGVQSLVRGHWKRQPHGPQSKLRKWIHREPFWRGPSDGPILVRPMDLGEK